MIDAKTARKLSDERRNNLDILDDIDRSIKGAISCNQTYLYVNLHSLGFGGFEMPSSQFYDNPYFIKIIESLKNKGYEVSVDFGPTRSDCMVAQSFVHGLYISW